MSCDMDLEVETTATERSQQNPNVVDDCQIAAGHTFRYYEFERLFPKPADGYQLGKYALTSTDESIVQQKEKDMKAEASSNAPQLVLRGPVAEAETVGDNFLHELCTRVAKNVGGDQTRVDHSSRYYKKLMPLQDRIFSCVLQEIPVTVAGERNSGKTTGYMMPLVGKVMNAAEMHKDYNSPIAIIVTSSEEKASHIYHQLDWIARGTSICHRLVRSFSFSTQKVNGRMDILVGPVNLVLNYLSFYKTRLGKLAFLIVDECDRYNMKSRTEPSRPYLHWLKELHDTLSKSLSHIYTMLVFDNFSNFATDKPEIIDLFFPDKESQSLAILRPPAILNFHMNVKSFHQPSGTPRGVTHLLWTEKISYLRGCLERTRDRSENQRQKTGNSGGPRTFKCLVVARKEITVNYLAGYLSLVLGVPVIPVSRNSDLVAIEQAQYHWRSGNSFVVCDYPVLQKLEQGYIENIICFELPAPQQFNTRMEQLIRLSSQMRRRRLTLFYHVMIDQECTTKLVKLLCQYAQPVPAYLAQMYRYLKNKSSDMPPMLEEYMRSMQMTELLNDQPSGS